MVKEGFPFVIIPAIIGGILLFFHWWVIAGVFILIAAFMAFFFRDPERSIPDEPDIVVAAADGRVTRIDEGENGKVVSVFLSPLDVHVNRSPIAGRITKIEYTEGRKSPATSDNASLVNERNSLTIKGEKMTVVCTQIAGIMARRIVCWNKTGDELEIGERFGMIKFGSRTDVLMPSSVKILVGIGDRVVGGETIIARLS
ncbi:MAG TPA: phosphatidylserine decarboxylase [Pyrinomonadaceae bacterium]|jgi:phosphatidylserine decarboxylase|nr:phosphatidylserine decarboxylase [Pyrinomonadaceae bacterium]